MSGLKKYIIFCSVFLIVYLLANYFKPKPTNWNPTYLTEDKIPYGTYILYNRIPDIFPHAAVKKTSQSIYNTLKENSYEPSNYLLIASSIHISKTDYDQMLQYMQKGNSIFLSAYQLNSNFLKKLKLKLNSDFIESGTAKLNFSNPKLEKEYGYRFKKILSGQYFTEIDTSKALVLGFKDNDEPNFVKYNFGKGALYILPNPQLFTNYSLLNPDGLDYASKALSYLPNAKTIIWDEHFTQPDREDASPLRVLFNHTSLRWAYYLALTGLIIFIGFEVKRRQRIIPVIERQKNTTAEFVHVVGRVYYQQRNNRDIAEKKVSYLLEYIRSKYRLKTLNLDEEFKQGLIRLSGANAETIENLLAQMIKLKGNQMVSDRQLISLNKIIEDFYKQDQ